MEPDYSLYAVGGAALLALIVGIVAFVQVRKMSRQFSWVAGGDGSSVDSLTALLRAVEGNQQSIIALESNVAEMTTEGRTHFKRLGIVRYNAFEGVAGQQSYSLCLLDENRNGILISNLVGTNFSRGYAVEIKEGEPARPLGTEETEALKNATRNGN
jgi:hypothetical protein